MPDFHETVRGVRFFDGQLPKLIGALERIADGARHLGELAERGLVVELTVTQGDYGHEIGGTIKLAKAPKPAPSPSSGEDPALDEG